MNGLADLRALLHILRQEDEILTIDAPVDADLEVAEIHRRVIAAGGPALMFTNVSGADWPLVTNLFGTARRVELAFGRRPMELIERLAALPQTIMPPSLGNLWRHRDVASTLLRTGIRRRRHGPVTEVVEADPRLSRLPMLRSWPEDGGDFLTLPLVYTEHPGGLGSNLGMYRVQRFSADEVGLHMQIHRGGGFHLTEYERLGRSMPVNIHVGGAPALMFAAIAPLPENVPELLLASLMTGRRLPMADNPLGSLPVAADAEIVLIGEIEPGATHPEGPFGDHYGYYSLQHDYPLVRVNGILRRKDPIVSATVVGKPRQEDFFLGDYLQELLTPLIRLAMPAVRDLWAYGETGYHSLAAAVVHERYRREAMTSAFRILGEGQLSLTKFLLVTDRSINLRDFPRTLEHILARCNFETDLFILSNVSMDTLDYAGPTVNEGSKGVLLGLGQPIRDLPREFRGALPAGFEQARVFCGGCLVVSGPTFAGEPDAATRLASAADTRDWQLIILCDDAARTTRSTINFLWTTFTRFEPAADIHSSATRVVRSHIARSAPIVIDSRTKPTYPDELFVDPDTSRLVDDRWREYFPDGQEMGDSDRAHLD